MICFHKHNMFINFKSFITSKNKFFPLQELLHRKKFIQLTIPATRTFKVRPINQVGFTVYRSPSLYSLKKFTKNDLKQIENHYYEKYFKKSSLTTTLISKIFISVITGILSSLLILIFFTRNTSIFPEVAITPIEVQTTFADVRGVNEAMQELQNVVEYLRHPEKFLKMGAKLPKGILLVGPPGTGKTLLARALAGEATVPCFYISGSEFEQTFVGEGARRVRNLFRAAKLNAPCVIFIDEIDAVGSKRVHSAFHPYSNQTINQLLTEMDGFRKNEGVIVLAATNNKEILDLALLRPGRFDVEITVHSPSFAGRKDIIQHYLQSIVCEKGVRVDELARGTIGFTGADLENMINRAALKAAGDNSEAVTAHHLYAERDRIVMGFENKSRIPDEASRKITAYHESGHCLVALFTPHSQPVHKISLVPRGASLGHTAFLPEKDEFHVSKAQLLARIDSLLGGRAAEELIFGPNSITSGGMDDLKTATELSRQMIVQWGMSENLGLRSYHGNSEGLKYRDLVDEEINNILEESYARVKTLLKKYSHEHHVLANALLKYETLDSNDIDALTKTKQR